jgi:hypothetical protein
MKSDLVLIDATGSAHPVGKAASQWMRARKGTFRLMPSPNHVVFMHYVGEEGARDEYDVGQVRLAGEIIAAGQICDIISLVSHFCMNGELVVLDGIHSRSIFFDKGNVIGANSSAERERIGEVLFRFGALDREQIDAVVNATNPGKRFGETAADLGYISREKLYGLMSKQTEEIVYGALLVDDGMFFMLTRYDESRLTSRHVLSASRLIMQSVQRMDEVRFFRERIPSDHYVPVKTGKDGAVPEDCEAALELSDGTMSIAEIGRLLEMGEFDTTKAVFQLMEARLVKLLTPRPTEPHEVIELFSDAMVLITRAVAEAKRVAELREQLSQFATSVGVYGALFRDAGPRPDGSFDPAKLARNIGVVSGADRMTSLSQWLYEYAAFGLFVARQLMPSDAEAKLLGEVNERIAVLNPPR